MTINSEKHQQVLSRHSDINHRHFVDTTILPKVNWSAIKQSPPSQIPIEERKPEDPLPSADIVILTWTSNEWFALDYIFLGGTTEMLEDKKWRSAWLPYSRSSSDYSSDKKSGPLWGYFQLVQISDLSGRKWKVLLFKSNSHLAHPPWIKGLAKMLQCIFEDSKPTRIYTIGTAGGARLNQYLGDAVITNTARLELKKPENLPSPDNDNTFRCTSWFPSTALIKDVESSLLYKMEKRVTMDSLKTLFSKLKEEHSDDLGLNEITLPDLLNDSIRPEFLGTPKIHVMKDVPLLTTDYYYVAKGHDSDQYSFLEMDDAVIAREANRARVNFACIRNISDPVVRDTTDNGNLISDKVRDDWSGLIYSNFGLQSSYNSALATWATIAGEGKK